MVIKSNTLEDFMKKLLIIGIMLTAECIFAAKVNPLEEWADKQEVWKKIRKEATLRVNEKRSTQELYGFLQQNLDIYCLDQESDACKWLLNQIRISSKENIDSYDSVQKIIKEAYDKNHKFLFVSLLNGLFERESNDIMINLSASEEDLKLQCREESRECHAARTTLYTLSKDETLKPIQKKYIHDLQKLAQ